MGPHPGMHYASVTMLDRSCAIMHSKAAILSVPAPPSTFHDRLALYRNSSLWGNLLVDGNETWLQSGVIAGILCIAHDGLHMAKELTTICSVGIVIYCRALWCWLKASVAEESDSASNCCGELLGDVLVCVCV
jgi:hypothetical protein